MSRAERRNHKQKPSKTTLFTTAFCCSGQELLLSAKICLFSHQPLKIRNNFLAVLKFEDQADGGLNVPSIPIEKFCLDAGSITRHRLYITRRVFHRNYYWLLVILMTGNVLHVKVKVERVVLEVVLLVNTGIQLVKGGRHLGIQ